MTNAALRGKPDAGNPHVRFDEGEVASATTPRRGSLLYRMTGRREFIVSGMALTGTVLTRTAYGSDDERPELTAAKRWFKEAQYGMMVHWGLYSLLAGEYRGRRMGQKQIGEWIQAVYEIPNAEYAKLAKVFNPIYFDAEEWVKTAQDAGMKYIVLTSKHHDGFALYRSKVSAFNVVDATPFGRDVVGELAEACRKHGMKLGLYYSQDLDWHERGGGGFTMGKTWGDGEAYWTNSWDFKDVTMADFDAYFERKCKPQVMEILTQYGDLCLIWFDIGSTLSPEQAKELYDMVRTLQPGCLVNSRIGGGSREGKGLGLVCDYTSAGDNQIPDDDKSGMLFESPATLNDTWGYKAADQNWKSAETIRKNREHLKAIGANYLLNVGPDGLGRIPAVSAQILHDANV